MPSISAEWMMKSSGSNNIVRYQGSRNDKMKFEFEFYSIFVIYFNIACDRAARKSSYSNRYYHPSVLYVQAIQRQVLTTKVRVPHQLSRHHLYPCSTYHTSNPAPGSFDSAPLYPKLPNPLVSKEVKKKIVSRDRLLSYLA